MTDKQREAFKVGDWVFSTNRGFGFTVERIEIEGGRPVLYGTVIDREANIVSEKAVKVQAALSQLSPYKNYTWEDVAMLAQENRALKERALSQQPVGEEELVEVIVECLNRSTVRGSMQRHIARTLLARFNISDRGTND